jgi:ornithine cyclodeaminase/alanine dehydrogenase-like protein (mu-crystallin family)
MRYLSEHDVRGLVSVSDSIAVVERALGRAFRGEIDVSAEAGLRLDGGRLAVAASFDPELELGAASVVASFGHEGGRSLAIVVEPDRPELRAVVETDAVRRLAAGAAVALAATRLAKPDACSIGLIGCGALGTAVLEALRVSGRKEHSVVAYCRDPEALAGFCAAQEAEAAEYGRDAAACDLVVTATTSRDPVLRGEWPRDGAFVAAAGAVEPGVRELDNVVVTRSAFICCDSLQGARHQADLAEPVEQGILDWLEVHELGEILAGELEGRQSDRDVVLFKSSGTQALTAALAQLALRRAEETDSL